jgi:hypothetical protein
MPCDTHWQPTIDFKFEKHCQLFGTDMNAEPYASATTGLRSWQSSQKANFLKQAEQFEDDYDDNDYSNYVEDVSVHAVTDIRLGLRWRAFMRADRRRALENGGSCLPPLIHPRHNHQAPWPLRSLSSAAFLAAALLAATSLLAATALLATTALLAATALFFALLAATALFVTITLFVAIALLAATALLAAFLSGSRRFDRFVRIVLCFHSVFLYFSY